MTRGIPGSTQAFIRRYISSIGQLESLLFMREHRETAFSATALAREQRSDPAVAEGILEELRDQGFLAKDGQEYSYSATTSELETEVEGLAEVYRTYRVAVINFVFSMPSDSVQSFADAFRIRRGDDDG